MITFEQMRIFLAVAEREHLTEAAKALLLTPSAVSSAIHMIEEHYQVRLFNRIGRRIQLSDAGSVFVEDCRHTLAQVKVAETTLREFSGLKRGALGLFASQTIANYFLPPVIAKFRNLYPAITVKMSIGNTEQVENAVLSGVTDIGFAEGTIKNESLHRQKVADDELFIIAAKNHPLTNKPSVKYKDISAFPWILREKGSGTRAIFEQALSNHGYDLADLEVMQTFPSNEAVLSAVAASNALTAISKRAVSASLAAGLVERLNFLSVKRDFLLLLNPQRFKTKAVGAFIDLLDG